MALPTSLFLCKRWSIQGITDQLFLCKRWSIQGTTNRLLPAENVVSVQTLLAKPFPVQTTERIQCIDVAERKYSILNLLTVT